MSSIMRRRNGLTPSFVIAQAPVCGGADSQTQPDRQAASLYKPSSSLSTGITAAIHGRYRGAVQFNLMLAGLTPAGMATRLAAPDFGTPCCLRPFVGVLGILLIVVALVLT